tara:strand:+ start:4944 stop:5621 length:678 start_codon:yes stop_codon:yes gene_type:complete
MSEEPAELNIDIETLPPLPADDPAEVFVLGELPPLPPISTSEGDELTAESEQPAHCDERDWDLLLPPWTYYFEYIGHVKFCRSCDQDGNTTIGTISLIRRAETHRALRYFMFMHKYLLANLHMLRTYGETGLATLNPSDELEDAQHRFAQNHTGISQCLDDMNQSFGLPYYDCTRQARNFFSHDYLTPRRSADSMQRAMRGKIKLYNGLFSPGQYDKEDARRAIG